MADPHFVVAVLDTSGNLVNAGDSANSLIRVSIVGGGGGGVTGSISAGTTKGTLGEVVFSNSPTVTFGMDGQTVTASAAGGAGGGAALSAGTQSVNTGTVVFANSNGMTFGMSGSSQITASYTVPSTAGLLSAVNVSAGTTSNNLSALTFANGGGVSFGLNASTVTATVRTDWLSTQSNQAFSAGAASSAFQTLVFNDANGVTWSNNAGSVQASYSQSTHSHSTAPGAIAAGTQTATSGTVVFSNSNGMVFGMSNSSVVTASWNDVTESMFWRPNDLITTVGAPINASASIVYCPLDHNLSASRFDMIASINVATAANNSSAGFLYSATAVIYTKNAGTLSSLSSTTTNNQMTWTSNATGSVTGAFFLSLPLNVDAVADKYWVGVQLSTRATGLTGAATTSLGNTVSMMGVGSAVVGAFSVREPGSATSNSNGWFYGMGMYSGTSNFSTIGLSNITQQGTNMNRADIAIRMVNV